VRKANQKLMDVVNDTS